MALVTRSGRCNVEVKFPCTWKEAAPLHEKMIAMGVSLHEEGDAGEAELPYGEIIGKKHQPAVRATFDSGGNHATFQINTGQKTLAIKARRPVLDMYGETFILFFGKVQAVIGTSPAPGKQAAERSWNPAEQRRGN